MKAMKARRRTFLACFEQENDGSWSVHVPALPGCYSQGESLEEARANVAEAIEAYLEGVRKDHQALGTPRETLIGSVEVEEAEPANGRAQARERAKYLLSRWAGVGRSGKTEVAERHDN